MSKAVEVSDLNRLKKDSDDFERIVSEIRHNVEALKHCNTKMGQNWDDAQYIDYLKECAQFLPLVGKFLESSDAIHGRLLEYIAQLQTAAKTFR